MTIALVTGSGASNTGSAVSSLTVVVPVAIAVGDLIIVRCNNSATQTLTATNITDTIGNKYTICNVNLANGSAGEGATAYAISKGTAAASGNTISVTWGSSGNPDIICATFNGWPSPPIVFATATGTGSEAGG